MIAPTLPPPSDVTEIDADRVAPGRGTPAKGSAQPDHVPPPSPPPTRTPVLDPLRLSAANPTRPASWRWQLAARIADGVAVPRHRVDAWVAYAARFALRLASCRSRDDRDQLRRAMPQLFDAHRLFAGPPPGRWHLEALVLAGSPRPAIADELGLDTEVVRAYSRLFFDLEGRLSNSALACQIAIGLAPGAPPRDPGQLWRLLGHLGGPEVVRRLAGLAVLDPAGAGRDDFELLVIERLRDQADLLALIEALGGEGPGDLARAVQLRDRADGLLDAARDRRQRHRKASEGIRQVVETHHRSASPDRSKAGVDVGGEVGG